MPHILIINKEGKIKNVNVKQFDESTLHTKAGFKNNDNFKKECWMNIETKNKTFHKIAIYGKIDGNARQENKYELPPPHDKILYFGNILIVHYDNDGVAHLKEDEWETIYDQLMGGFEDIDSDDDEESEEDDTEGLELDKNGYEKDGFICDDNEIEEEEEEDSDEDSYESELSEEEYFED